MKKNKTLVPLVLILLGAFIAIPIGTRPVSGFTGVVCIAPSSTNSCPASPVSLTGILGLQTTIAVNIQGSDPINGFRIYVKTDPTVLNPVSVDMSNSVLGPPILLLANCINGSGTACNIPSGLDGPGIVDLGVVSFAGLTSNPTTGRLFSITYELPTTSAGTSVIYESGCPLSSSDNTCVTITGGGATAVPETLQTATFSSTATPTFVSSANPTSLSVSNKVTAMSTITFKSINGFTGTVTLAASINPLVKHGPSILLSTSSITLGANGSASATLTTSVKEPAPLGTYQVVVAGTGGGQSASVQVTVTVL